jgi:protein TonB
VPHICPPFSRRPGPQKLYNPHPEGNWQEAAVFTQLERPKRGSRWLRLGSIAIHALILYALIHPPKPIFLAPSPVMWGQQGKSTQLVYLTAFGAGPSAAAAKEQEKLSLARRKARERKAKLLAAQKEKAEAALAAPRAGMPYGSLLTGPASGHDVRPAIPTVFPDPLVYPWQIPAGVQGNVIVEITIDERGSVTDMKVLQALGYGIEDKVLAALRNWRFRPATIDGRAIASQQDVHFRFPSSALVSGVLSALIFRAYEAPEDCNAAVRGPDQLVLPGAGEVHAGAGDECAFPLEPDRGESGAARGLGVRLSRRAQRVGRRRARLQAAHGDALQRRRRHAARQSPPDA